MNGLNGLSGLSGEWLVLPVLLPLVTAAVMLLLGEQQRGLKAVLNVLSTLGGLLLSLALLAWVDAHDTALAFAVALPGNWPVPYGITLVADRLSALMAVLAGSVGLAALLYALPRWQHAGVSFHALFQLQLMGLYGAFLTADLFNLFVFFEVLLAASYGLLLHGGGPARVRAGLHYIAINLLASLLFLIGVAVLYGVTGSLSFADIAQKLPQVPTGDRGLLHAGAAILAVAFLVKAALWPLNFWLPGAYGSASAPASALFAILTKVGAYAVFRLWTLCFPEGAGASASFGAPLLIWGGLATLAVAAVGLLAAQQLERLAACSVIASAGTLIAALGFNAPLLSSAALFYLASSTLAGCTLFLLVEPLERTRHIELGPAERDDGRDPLPAFGAGVLPPDVNLDDDERALTGRAIPGAMAFLGVGFVACALVIAGLPPLSGFVAKLALLQALMPLQRPAAWLFFALLILSGLCAAIGLMRIGIRFFWTAQGRRSPGLGLLETLPIAALLWVSGLLVVQGERVLAFAHATASGLHAPQHYIRAVLAARPVPGPGQAGSPASTEATR